LKKFIAWLLGLPIAIILIALSVANRQSISFSLDPIARENPLYAIDLPLFVPILGAMFIGLLFGSLIVWINQGRWRRAARKKDFDARYWQEEAEKATKEATQAEQTRINALLPKGETD